MIEPNSHLETSTFELMGNCLLAMCLGSDEDVIQQGREAWDKHVSELSEGWMERYKEFQMKGLMQR